MLAKWWVRHGPHRVHFVNMQSVSFHLEMRVVGVDPKKKIRAHSRAPLQR